MAREKTLAELRGDVRDYCDCNNDPHISDSFLNNVINRGIQKLLDLVISSFGSEYYITTTTITADGTGQSALPSDFLSLQGIDNGTYEINKMNFHRRNQPEGILTQFPWAPRVEYRIIGNETLYLAPPAPSGTTLTLWYIPLSTVLTDDDDTFDFINGWEEWVILWASIRVKIKKEDDIRDYLALLASETEWIFRSVENQDLANEEVIEDVYRSERIIQ